MSRLVNGFDGTPVCVETDVEGKPTFIDGLPISEADYQFREWVGILNGEPQVDVWHVKTVRGIAQLHFACYPKGDQDIASGTWHLVRWED